MAAYHEEMGHSIFGPVRFNSQAPDDGNMILLNRIGTDEQKNVGSNPFLEWIYRYARQGRLVDGASEVHKMVLSRNYLKEGLDFWH